MNISTILKYVNNFLPYLFIDIIVSIVSTYLSYSIRLESYYLPFVWSVGLDQFKSLYAYLFCILIFIPIFKIFKIYDFIPKYFDISFFSRIFYAILVYGLILFITFSITNFGIPTAAYLTLSEFLLKLPKFQDEMILVKGARKFSLERIIDRLEAKKHRTQLEIRLEGIVQNLNQYKQRLSENTKIMVMVKAFGYGGGSLEIANVLQFHNIDYLGVAYLDEAIALRKNGIETPIMVMNPDLEQLKIFKDYDLEPEIYNIAGLKQVLTLVSKPKIHLKIDTGMHRLGFDPSEVYEIKRLLSVGTVEVAGIFTHFSMADMPLEDNFTHNQGQIFKQTYDILTEGQTRKPLKYACNSSAIIRFPEYQFDMVRLGIGLYGFDPSGSMNLDQVSVLKTRISQIKKVKKGAHIGYGTDGLTKRDVTIAIVPIGYADGYGRVFGKGRGFMDLNNNNVPTIGNICMDMTMLDVTGLDCSEGDRVIVFGENPTIENLAEWAQTIPYEILTSISERVSRIFIG